MRLSDFTCIILNPDAEAAMSAFVLALSIACLIRLFLVCSNFLSVNEKSMLLIVLAPAATDASIHFVMFLIFEVSICIELNTVNPVILPVPPDDCE